MADIVEGKRGGIGWAVIITIVAALAQFIGYGIWLGGMSKQIDVNTARLFRLEAENLPSEIAVMQSEHRNLVEKVMQIDRHIDAVDERQQKHIEEDREIFRRLQQPQGLVR